MLMSDDEGHAPNPLSIAFSEIAPKHDEDGDLEPGSLSFDERNLNKALGLAEAPEAEEEVSIDDLVSQIDEALEAQPAEAAEVAADDEPAQA